MCSRVVLGSIREEDCCSAVVEVVAVLFDDASTIFLECLVE